MKVEKVNPSEEEVDEMISIVPPMLIEVFFGVGREQGLGVVVRSKYFRCAHDAIAKAIGETLQEYINKELNKLKSKAD